MTTRNLPQKGCQARRKSDGLIGEVFSCDHSKELITVKWSARQGHNTLVCTSEQFGRDWELTGKRARGSRLNVLTFALPVILGICFYGLLKGCVRTPAGPSPSVPISKTAPVNPSTTNCTTEPVAELTKCIESHSDGVMTDIELAHECPGEIKAYIKGCEECGGGDEHTCADKAVYQVSLERAAKKYLPEH